MREQQLPGMIYPRYIGKVLGAYYRGADHPFKLRILSAAERALGRRRIVMSNDAGFLMALDQAELIQRVIMYEGYWERELTAILQRELRCTDIVYDIGANVGYFSCVAARAGSDVLAFEPDPLVCEVLSLNVRLNGFERIVRIVQMGLSNQSCSLPFERASDSGVSGFGHWDNRKAVRTILVPVSTIDTLVYDGAPTPTVLKVDVEGWETQVFDGAKKLFKVAPPRLVVFEAEVELGDGGLKSNNLRDLFSNAGYSVERVERVNRPLEQVENYVARR